MPENKNADLIAAGFKQAEALTKRYAKTFYFASHFLPEEKRLAAYSVYAVCRLSDESVDNPVLNSLVKIKHDIKSVYGARELNKPLLSALREIVNKYNIPKSYFDELIEGMEMDLRQNRYKDFAELNKYCYCVAGVVGLIMLKVFGSNTKEAENPAVDLGIAMQLTNILRDIKEDFQRGRIYLPADEMTSYGLREDDIAAARLNDNLKNLLKFQIQRARQYYANSDAGVKLIPGMACRFTVLAMKEMYAGILDAIENSGYDVFSRRAHLNTTDKIFTTFKILLQAKYV